MSDPSGKNGTASNVRNLSDAIRKVRVAESERTDVVVELREAERVRLDMLADELRGVFSEVPEGDEQFVFQISPGTQPRFWIDMTSFVMMARDRRTYRFLKDTRLGRTVILETASLDDMADCVTQYVAERIIERERALEGDWLVKRVAQHEAPAKAERGASSRMVSEPVDASRASQAHPGWIVSAFLGGILVGAIVLLGYAWVHVG